MVTKKPSKKLRQLCKKLKIKTTLKRGGKRVYKSNAVLIKQIRKMKRRTLSKFGACGCGNKKVPMFGKKRKVRYGMNTKLGGPHTVMNFGKKKRTSKRKTSKKSKEIRKLHKLCKLYKVKIGKKSNTVLRKQCLKKAKQMLKKIHKKHSRFGSLQSLITGGSAKDSQQSSLNIKKLYTDNEKKKIENEKYVAGQQERLLKIQGENAEKQAKLAFELEQKKMEFQLRMKEKEAELERKRKEKDAEIAHKAAEREAKLAADASKKAADASKKAADEAAKAAKELAKKNEQAAKAQAAKIDVKKENIEAVKQTNIEIKAATDEAKVAAAAAPASAPAAFGKRFSKFGSMNVSNIENKIPSVKKSKIKKALYNVLKKAGYKLGDYTDYTLKALLKMTVKYLGPIVLTAILVKYRVKVYNTLVSEKDRKALNASLKKTQAKRRPFRGSFL